MQLDVLADERAHKEVAVLVAFLPSVVQINAQLLADLHKIVGNKMTQPRISRTLKKRNDLN